MRPPERPAQQDKRLHKQVERILDEGTGPRRSVIVQMASASDDTLILLKRTTEAIQQRQLALSARDVLPPRAETLETLVGGGRLSASVRRELSLRGASIASQVAALRMATDSQANLVTRGMHAIQPLLDSQFVQEAIQNVQPANVRPLHFWSSGSVVLELRKDDLRQLPDNLSGIADIFPNRVIHAPPLVVTSKLPQVVEDNKASAWGVRMIGALSAWGAYGARGEGVKIGLLDTGIDPTHPALAGRLADWAEFDEQGNQVQGSVPHDSGKHGTHCAGTLVGGRTDEKPSRWIGVAPAATLAAGLVLDGDRGGTDAQILAGMQWAIDRGVHVISMSLGGIRFEQEVLDTYTRTIITANRLGIPVVMAVGNEGSQTSGSPGNDYFAFTVGATDHRDWAAGFSGGRTQVIRQSRFIDQRFLPVIYSKPEVSAPGVAVYSCIPGRKYEAFNGTSMATPHVAGAIALLLSATNIGTAVEADKRAYLLQDLLIGSVEELGESGQNHRFGFGRIDVLRAIGFAYDQGYGR